MAIDMLCHWRYSSTISLEMSRRSLPLRTHVPERRDEAGQPFSCTPTTPPTRLRDRPGVIAHFNSSWCVRVRRDDLLTLQVDGPTAPRCRPP